ncbi:hypothetical protein L1049_004102 [Liquidambar formosana]|uniref:Uncharacterized protein n=1 Tax=Liquidambar formosana TaxID=63359 RepID=A0AAP0RRJ0_LIQFO
MLRKNPEFRPSAAELLSHPHLQPYVLKIHLKSNNPRRHTFPLQWSDSNYVKKIRFLEPKAVPIPANREKRRSFSNDRALNPSISGTEQDSPCYTRRAQEFPSHLNEKFTELSVDSSIHEEIGIDKSTSTKFPCVAKTPRLTQAKVSATPRRQTVPSKISRSRSNRDSVSSYIENKFSIFQTC